MRLIDADELEDVVTKANEQGFDITRYEFKRIELLIFEFPTVEAEPITLEKAIDYLHKVGWLQEHDKALTESAEPIRHGRWSRERLPSTDGGSYEVFRCNLCNEAFNWRTPYCPNCGSKMCEVEE